MNSTVVCTGVTWLCETRWSESILRISSKRPYNLRWVGLGFLPGFLFSFCLLRSQELWKSEFHPSMEGKKNIKLLVGQDILVPVSWVCMTARPERCVREKKPEADVSVACGKGSKDVCEALTNSCLDKDTQTGIYENSSVISALNLASGCHPGASQERWHKDKAATSHIPRYHRSLSLDETKSFLVWQFWKLKQENLSPAAVLGSACEAWQSSEQNFSIARATKTRCK